jgi:hypothetical protein
VYTWLPIHQFSLEDVWNTLGWTLEEVKLLQADVKRRVTSGDYKTLEQVYDEWGYRWGRAYALGNQRLSCSLCPLASRNDLINGVAWNSDHFRDISSLERRSGFSFQSSQWLSDLGDLSPEEQEELDEAKLRNKQVRQQAQHQRQSEEPKQLTLL